MNAETNLVDRISTKHPELVQVNQVIFAASRQLDEPDDSVDDSVIDALDLSTPSKQLESTVCIPETPSPVFSRTTSKRERNDNTQTDSEYFSKRTCQFASDRCVLPSTKIFSKFVSPQKSEDSKKVDNRDDQPKTVGDSLTGSRECDSDSAISSKQRCTAVLASQHEKQRSVKAKRYQTEGCLKKTVSSDISTDSVCQNGYKNSQYGTGYIGWPSDSDDSDSDNIPLRDVIRSRELTNDLTKQEIVKKTHKQTELKQKSFYSPANSCGKNFDLDKGQHVRDEKQKIKNRSSPKFTSDRNDSCHREKRLFIPRSELTVRNIFGGSDVSNSKLKPSNGRSFRPPTDHLPNCRKFSSCRYANTSMDSNRTKDEVSRCNRRENDQDQTHVSTKVFSSNQMSNNHSMTDHIPTIFSTANQMSNTFSTTSHISPTISTTNRMPNAIIYASPTLSLANEMTNSFSTPHVSPTRSTTHQVSSSDEASDDGKKAASEQTNKPKSAAYLTPNTSPCFNSGHNRNRNFSRPVFQSSGFIDLHPESDRTSRPSCMFSHLTDGSGVDVNPPSQPGGEHEAASNDDVVLLDSTSSEECRPTSSFDCSLATRRTRTATRRKSRVSGSRRRGDMVSHHLHHRPTDVIQIEDNVEMDHAVSLVDQLESDEQLAKRLQEEMDMELAMSLHEAHSVMDGRAHPGRYDMDSAGIPPGILPMFQAHIVSPVRRRSYNSVRQANMRSRRRHRGGDDDLLLAIDGEGHDDMMLPFHQRTDMDHHNMVMMEAHILSLLESPVRRGRRRGVGGRGPRNFIFGVGHSGEGNDYEELLALAENLGDVKSKGISTAEINRLPTRDYKKPEGPTDEIDDCLICMCEYKEGECQRILNCFHEFHAKCIDKWLKSSATCPVCRVDVRS
ncbi:uncharacterized protein LOC121381866 [Gigantopelta aegis]|uniref:uncharacterized protein LOC121381866 n=1 Tax=Gigantopelta aegis TaxID=1735272 RepID=UPI001B88DCDC|nr:uncharacterized protein LOC121381866 [Gigantopelta aegis]XP_041367179.1 uncharacterized protein LOC121381866 [Gigantopelta aegis]XP_041367180.1 uncharacterized protein LOC121381866 [Gigantopelta aegis]